MFNTASPLSLSVSWLEWSILGRSPHLNGCYGGHVAVTPSWISEKWRIDSSIRSRWEPGERERGSWLRDGYGSFLCGRDSLWSFRLLFLRLQGEMVQWTVFLISYWGDQIGQKVKKICDWCVNLCIRFFFVFFLLVDFHTAMSVEPVEHLWISPPHSFRTQTFAYPESTAEREEILQGLQSRIEDIKSVSVVHVYKSTEHYLLNTDTITSIAQSFPMSVSHLKILESTKIAVMCFFFFSSAQYF